MKILIVDDDEFALRMVRSILKAECHEVCTASNGLFGYSTFVAWRSELVLTDIEMPFQDGIQMMKEIRKIDPSVRTIYMSGEVERYRSQLDDERQEYSVAVLEKPFSRLTLLALVPRDYHRAALTSKAEFTQSGKRFGS